MRFLNVLDDAQCESLQEFGSPIAVGGDSDWRIAVYAYRGGSGRLFLREVAGNRVRGWEVADDASVLAYVAGVEAEYLAAVEPSDGEEN